MKRNGLGIILLWAVTMLNAPATNVYVRVPGGGAAQYPYTNWVMAATNIQDAIDAINTNGGNYVFVSNGTYYLTNQITITKGITLQSWNQGVPDQTNTVIHGNNYVGKPVKNRCIEMDHPQVRLVGFTITKGVATNAPPTSYGGGVYIANSGFYVADCIITGNIAETHGGGIYSSASTGIIERCIISRNYSSNWTGGVVMSGISTMRQCVVSFNTCEGYGGGAYLSGSYGSAEARDCSFISNVSATSQGGGGILLRTSAVARNCLIAGNTAAGSLGGGGVAFWSGGSRVINCTITGNSATYDKGGGIECQDDSTYRVENSIVYGNLTSGGDGTYSNYYKYATGYIWWTNCCSVPSLNEISPGTNVNNIAEDPRFAAASTGNYRLARSSPCVNTGTNRSWMTPQAGGLDLDGNRRIMMLTVDMGAYELAPPSGMIVKFR